MIRIQEVSTKKELKQFVRFPFSLYKNNPYWVPPIIREELESFDPDKNPVFEHAEARFFLAYRDGKIAGRIAAIVNWTEIREQQVKKMRFGWMDFIDDKEVSKLLLEKVEKIGREHGLEFLEGPVGFSNLDKVGVLTEGFDQIGTMVTWYNHPYYQDHFRALGFVPANKFIESYFYTRNADASRYERMAQVIKSRYDLRPLSFRKTKEVLPFVDEMFELFNLSYEKLPSFVSVSKKQIAYFKKKYIPFINPEFIKMVVDKENRLIAFAITMPSFAKALQKAGGKLFPTGFLHLLLARKKSKESIFYLIGILPSYRKKGVTAIIFDEYHKSFKKYGIEKGVLTPELEENKDIQLIWSNFDPQIHKRRTTFRKMIQ